MVSSCVLLFFHLGGSGDIKKVSVLLLIYVLAYLMVSNHSYNSFKDPELVKRQPFGFLVLAIIFIIVIVAQPEIMLFAMASLYIASGPITTLLRRLRRKKATADQQEVTDGEEEGADVEQDEADAVVKPS
jgi:CDP-diacylglycerol--serine O-phosphatidyltransferase